MPMGFIVLSGLLVVMTVVAYQDFRYRTINLFSLIAFSGLAMYLGAQELTWQVWLMQTGINLSFIFIQLFLITIWFSIKEKRWTNIADQYLGWGDILFFIPIALLFNPVHFMCFYIGSLLSVLVGFLCYQMITTNPSPTIPLAGGMAICLIFTLLFVGL